MFYRIFFLDLDSQRSNFLDPPSRSYLTNNMPGVERFPLSFQSQFSGNHFHHIVLGVHSGGRFGALGISRREDLMFKPLELRTLMDLVQEFEGAYRGYWHTLRKVRIGQYVSHDPHSVEQIEWKHSILDVEKLTKEELRKELERHTRDMRLKVQHSGFCTFNVSFCCRHQCKLMALLQDLKRFKIKFILSREALPPPAY